MNLIFFQNIISPHQMPYIQHLPKMEGVEQVVVIVPKVNLEERDSLGWNTEKWLQTEGIRFLVAPTEEEVERVLKVNETLRYETLRYETLRYETLRYENHNQNENENEKQGVTWCLFSGINAFPEVAKWFRMSLKYNVRRGVITEPPYVYDHPLWQHAIRFALKDWRYVKYIDKIFVMGEDYLNYYRFWSKRWEVIPFMYCTGGNVLCKQSEQARANETLRYETRSYETRSYENENENQKENGNGNENENENQNENENGERVRVVYVGSLSHRKNVGCLLKAAKLLSKEEQEQLEIGIVGDGDEREALERLADGLVTPVRFYGTQPMEMIPDIMGQYDVLVLPSLHDGWGAVVNEALMLGLYVICSDHCGAKMLIKEESNGLVFKSNDSLDLSNKLGECLTKTEIIKKGLQERISWSRGHITGKAVADYFLSNIHSN